MTINQATSGKLLHTGNDFKIYATNDGYKAIVWNGGYFLTTKLSVEDAIADFC